MKNSYKAQSLELQLTSALDSAIESKDREQCLDSFLTLMLINGGHEEKYWGDRNNSEEGVTFNPKNFMGAEIIKTDAKKTFPKNKRVHLLFYGGARKVGDNASFYYASLNVLKDYKKYYPNDLFIHEFVDSAETIVDKINEQDIESIVSLDLFFHGSKWGLYMYKGASMYKKLLINDIEEKI